MKFYRDKANGKIAGVCAGISDYFGVDVTLVRVGCLVGAILTGFGFGLYLLTAWIAPVRNSEARLDAHDPQAKKFWQDVRKNPRRTARAVRGRFRELDRRLATVEAYLTSPDRRLAREIDQLR
jgi:phage shock protein C